MPRAEGFAANFESPEESTDEEMDDTSECPTLQRIHEALEGKEPQKAPFEFVTEKLTPETKLLMSQDPEEILALAACISNGEERIV